MIPNELRDVPKLMRLHRSIRYRLIHLPRDDLDAAMRWIDVAIADWSREERRRRKARKRRA